jgi:hypothetical protein
MSLLILLDREFFYNRKARSNKVITKLNLYLQYLSRWPDHTAAVSKQKTLHAAWSNTCKIRDDLITAEWYHTVNLLFMSMYISQIVVCF